jgi:hydrogenase-4 component B
MAALAVCCIAIGAAPLLAAPLLDEAIRAWTGAPAATLPALESLAPLGWIGAVNACVLLASVALMLVVKRGWRRLSPPRALTWDCGFAAPAPRMQYTASSFAQMLVSLLAFMLRPRAHRPHLHGHFPHRVGFKSHVDDLVLEGWILPALRAIQVRLMRLRVLQQGRVQIYVLYVFIVLVLMLIGSLPIHELLLRLLSP